jgi:Protein of unknown function (DUF3224)
MQQPKSPLRSDSPRSGIRIRGFDVKALKVASVVAFIVAGLMATAGTAGATPAHHGPGYICSGGDIAAGSYSSIVVKGSCYMPSGTVQVRGNVTIAPGALLDAGTPGDPSPANPLLAATVLIGGNVSVGNGGVLILGCSPDSACQQAVNYDRIGGNLTGSGALGVVIHSIAIGGNVSLIGGGGGTAGPPASGACFGAATPEPWASDPSLGGSGTPVYSDFEDSTIGGNFTIIGRQSCFNGTFRNEIGGNATFIANTMGDPDAMEVTSNEIGRNLTCASNLPAVQFGDSGGSPNTVAGRASGECGFNVVLPKTPPEGAPGATVNTHISVRETSLRTAIGAHVQTSPDQSQTVGTSASGESLLSEVNDVVFTGHGLTGAADVDPTNPPPASGEIVLITVHKDGSQSFLAADACVCTFHGKTGPVTIEAYGTVSRHGLVQGRFVIRNAGGDLATLAGHGTFTSAHQPPGALRLTERLELS